MTLSILVTTDGSPASLRVLPHAAAIARASAARVTLLRVLNPLIDTADVFALDHRTAIRIVEDAWRVELAGVLAAASIVGDVRVERLGRREEVSRAILRVAGETSAGLLAMHSRGSGVLRHALLGSVAMGVLTETAVPLLLTGQREEPPVVADGPYRIVVATDRSPASDACCLAMMPLIDECKAEVTLLTVSEAGDGRAIPGPEEDSIRGHLERVRGALAPARGIAIDVQQLRADDDLPATLIRTAVNRRANALALSTHGESALRHVLMGSTALAVLERSPLPLLLTRYGGHHS